MDDYEFEKEVELFLKNLSSSSELDLLTQLIFKFNLHEKLQAIAANNSRVDTKVSCSISYIDKRPIVSFDHDIYDKNIELGDALIILSTKFDLSRFSTKDDVSGRAVIIQAKKEEKLEIMPRN